MPQILDTPGSFFSLHGDLIFVVYDGAKANDPVTYPDYRYICDVYSGSELVARLKAYPNPTTKMGVFNVSNILRNYATPVFNPAIAISSQNLGVGEFNVSGTCIFGEEYDFVQYLNVSGDTGRIYFNHYNGRLLGSETNLSAYSNKPATARPLRQKVQLTSNYHFIPYLMTASAVTADISAYDSGGNLQGTYAYSSGSGVNNSLKSVNVSPGAINAASPGLINSNTSYYTVNFTSPAPDVMYTFDILCEPKHTVYSLHFLNRFGGFESRDFTKLSRKAIDIEKKDFGKLPYTINDSGVVSYYNSNNVYNETRAVYSSQYKEKMLLNSDYLTDDEYTWLADLILSPMVYMEMGSYLIPVVITGNNYEFKKGVNDRASNLTINIEFGDQFNAQYR